MRSVMRTETVKKVEIEVLDLLKALEIDPKKYMILDVRLGKGMVDVLTLNFIERPYETGK